MTTTLSPALSEVIASAPTGKYGLLRAMARAYAGPAYNPTTVPLAYLLETRPEAILALLDEIESKPAVPAQEAYVSLHAGLILPAKLGDELQGGIYAGPHIEDGQVRHLIAAHDTLPESQWDAARKAAIDYRGGGFEDWRLPSKNESMTALMHAQHLFERAVHWTSTPYGQPYAWAVGFEDGNVYDGYRGDEFRVRPFRRFAA